MKKLLIIFLSVFIFTGCNMGANFSNTPIKQVEAFFNKYQTLDKEVLDDLDRVVAEADQFNGEQRVSYRNLMKDSYKKLSYDIKEERIDGNRATVTATIEVVDYSKILRDTDQYLMAHPEEFTNESGDYDVILFNDYRLKQLKKAKDMVKYTLDLHLTKKNDEWVLDELDSEDENKIHGVYEH